MTKSKEFLEKFFSLENINRVVNTYFPGVKEEEERSVQRSTKDNPEFSLVRLSFQQFLPGWLQGEEIDNATFYANLRQYVVAEIRFAFKEHFISLLKISAEMIGPTYLDFLLTPFYNDQNYIAGLESFIRVCIVDKELKDVYADKRFHKIKSHLKGTDDRIRTCYPKRKAKLEVLEFQKFLLERYQASEQMRDIRVGNKFYPEKMLSFIEKYFTKPNDIVSLEIQYKFNNWYLGDNWGSLFWKQCLRPFVSEEVKKAFQQYIVALFDTTRKNIAQSIHPSLLITEKIEIEFLFKRIVSLVKSKTLFEAFFKGYVAQVEWSEYKPMRDRYDCHLRKIEYEVIALIRVQILIMYYQKRFDEAGKFLGQKYLDLELELQKKLLQDNFSQFQLAQLKKSGYEVLWLFQKDFAKDFDKIFDERSKYPMMTQIEIECEFLQIKTIVVLNTISQVSQTFVPEAENIQEKVFSCFDTLLKGFLFKGSELLKSFRLSQTNVNEALFREELEALHAYYVTLTNKDDEPSVELEGKIIHWK